MTNKPTDFTVTVVPTNFVYPDITHEDFKFGSGELLGTPLRADGDWRDYLPPEEDQNVRGIESSACYVEASQHTIATLEEEGLGEKNNNYSARFNALLSGGTRNGGNPLQGADSIRHDGLVPESLMPFDNAINSWEDYHSFKGVAEAVVRAKGKEYLGQKILGYDIVCERDEPVATKYIKLKLALQYSPCPVSVTAWYENNGIYYKPEGLYDNHLVELVYIDVQNRPYIRDTYSPYLKILEPNFNFDFAMRWSVDKRAVPTVPTFPPYLFLKNLYYGMTNPEVPELQKALMSLGYTIPHGITDFFGNETKSALSWFQLAHRISDDGTHFGPRTRQAMNTVLNPGSLFGGSFFTFVRSLFSGT